MQPTLAWLDFNTAERERTQRVLALLDQREARDELGLGGIRDSFSDYFFPGTSTIQTRLRYLFFVPWIYQDLERRRLPARDVVVRARNMELDLTKPLLEVHGAEAGVFGRIAKEKLKRLPSSVYWAALRQYGICRYASGREDFHRDFESLWRRRQRGREDGEGGELLDSPWHPKLPKPPEDFPESPTFLLTREEARFFQHCLEATCPDSLLMFLAWHSEPADIDFPWEHPDYAKFSDRHRELLDNARLFSETMHGASILYNWMLADVFPLKERSAEYSAMFADWTREMATARPRIQKWDLSRFWVIAKHPNHSITPKAQRFVQDWISLLLRHGVDLGQSGEARKLVHDRETDLKKAKSRFNNRCALEKWGGAAGLGRISFRWASADQFLRDLQDGLQQA